MSDQLPFHCDVSSYEAASYDTDNNIVSHTTRAGQSIGYCYDSLNRRSEKTLPLDSCSSPQPSTTVVTYTYDLAGRRTGVSDNSAAVTSISAPTSPLQYTASYSYDPLNHLSAASWTPAPAAAIPTSPSSVAFQHSYNADNQRIGQTASDSRWISYPSGSGATSYAANALNQYTAVGAASPTYDTNGNLTFDGTYSFGYDIENHLVSANGGGTTATYAFDGRGRRKSKTVNGTTTITITDADNRAVLDYDGTSGALLRWYAYGPGPNDVLNQMNVPAGSRSTLLPDIQGSIVATLDSDIATLSPFGYQPYGSSAAAAAPFGYTGQQIDTETGLYYYRARHYSPAWGRFVQADPIGYADGTPAYLYADNDPLNQIDPLGLWTIQVGGSIYVNFGWFSVTGSLGIVADSSASAGYYASVASGPAVGGGFKFAANTAVTTAPTIQNLQGWSAGASAVLGVGPAASIDWSKGYSGNGQTYNSYGGSIGLGAGGGLSAGPGYTWIWPQIAFDSTSSVTLPPSDSSSLGESPAAFSPSNSANGNPSYIAPGDERFLFSSSPSTAGYIK